ncbi:MAG: polysaccharide deacetylase family protein, partial [Elusimicrobiota bacterium]
EILLPERAVRDSEMLKNIPNAVSIDLDGQWASKAALGCAVEQGSDPYFSAVPRFLDLCEKWRLKATFFVVGWDLKDRGKRRRIQDIHRQGHEIGNHSLTHVIPFSDLSRRRKFQEIDDSGKRIADSVGEAPVGFRAPAYGVDEETLEILSSLGYQYDSSVMPTPLLLGRRITAAWHYGWKSRSAWGLGRLKHCLAPKTPYLPARMRLWTPGKASLWEIPVTVITCAMLPLSSTLCLTMPEAFTRWMTAICRHRKQPFHWTFHLRDLVDAERDGVDRKIAGLPVVKRPLAQKLKIVEQILFLNKAGPLRDVAAALGPPASAT